MLIAFFLGAAALTAGPPAAGKPQEASDAPRQEEAGKKESPQPGAGEILMKAAEVQGGKEIAAKLNNFKAEFESEYIKPDKGKVYYEVERVFMFPSYLWTRKKHEVHKKPSIEGYDGLDGWIRMPDGKLTVYTDSPARYENDMENLAEDARLTRQMFRYFFIANLRDEINDLNRLSDKPVPRSGKPAAAYTLEGKVTGWIGKDKTVRLKIFVDPEKYIVRAVQMDDLDLDGRRRLFLFDDYTLNSQGILVPMSIQMFSDNEAYPEMKISINGKEGKDPEGNRTVYPNIEFNLDLDVDLFKVPEEE
jgi:hypothetical protein